MKKFFKKVFVFIFIFSLILPRYTFAYVDDIFGDDSEDTRNERIIKKDVDGEDFDDIFGESSESEVENEDKNKNEEDNTLSEEDNDEVSDVEDNKVTVSEWEIENFVIEGDTIYGFSEVGIEKLKSDGNLVLPSKNGDIKIIKIASFAFYPKKQEEIPNFINREGDNGEITSKDVDGYEIKNIGFSFNDTLLKSVTIPDGYEFIGQDAFVYNKNLSTVNFANTITRISDYAFGHISFDGELFLPKNIESLGDSAFMDSTIKGTLSLPKSLKDLGERTFKGNSITNIVFKGENISKIGEKVFEDNKIEKVHIPNSIKEIKTDAFNSNYGDEDYGYVVTLWTSQKNNPNSLAGASFYVDPTDDKKVPKLDINYNIWEEKDFESDKNVVLGFSEIGKLKVRKNKELIIPSEIKGVKITEIRNDAFRNVDFDNESLRKYDLISVKLPENIKKIGDFAFQSNSILELDVQSNENLIEIGKGAFMNNKIATLSLNDGLKIIDDAAFHINNMEFVFLPKAIEKVGMSAFRENKISIFMANCDNLAEIGEMAFLGNAIAELDLKTLPKLKVIGVQSFAGNIINSISFPEGIEEIKEEAFRKNALEKVEIPNSINRIAFNSFDENKGSENYKKVEISILNGNKNKIPEGTNFVINVNELAKNREKLRETVEKISKLNLDSLQENTKKIFVEIEKEGKVLLDKKDLREAEMLKYIFETNFLIDRSNIDILVKKAKESILKSNDKDKNGLLQDKIEYAEKNYTNSALTERKVKRLERELELLTDLVNGTGEISNAVMVQGHHELKSPLPIPSYHILVNVYFDKTGKILYVLDRSYDVGKGTKSEYGTIVENVDEDNAGYHLLAIDTLEDYSGIYSKDILSKTVDTIDKITEVEKAKYHREGIYNAVKDACEDFKFDYSTLISVISLDNSDKIKNLELFTKKLDKKINSLSEYKTLIYDIHFEKDSKEITIKDGRFKVTLAKEKGLGNVQKVYYISDDGKLEEINFTQSDEILSFETTHFSEYAICYSKNSENNNVNTIENNNLNSNEKMVDNSKNLEDNKIYSKNILPKTNISNDTIALSLLLLISFIGLVIRKKLKNN